MPEYFYPLIKNVELNGTQLEIPNVQHSADSNFRFYVDCINGNDSYIGTGNIEDDEYLGSKKHPFRTIDKFFDLCNEIKSDIRCYLVSPGLYTISKDRHASFVGIAVHITALADNITLYFEPKTVSYPFYDCHLNLRGAAPNTIEEGYPDHQVYMTIAGEGFYMDAGNCSIEYCIFTNRISAFYGGGYHIANCEANRLLFRYANVRLGNLKFTGTPSDHLMEFLSCNVTYSTALEAKNLTHLTLTDHKTIDIFHFSECNAAFFVTDTSKLEIDTTGSNNIHGIYARATTLNMSRGVYFALGTEGYSIQDPAYPDDPTKRIITSTGSPLGNRITEHSTGCNICFGYNIGINATGTYNYNGNISKFNTIRLVIEFPNDCYRYFDIANTNYSTSQNFNIYFKMPHPSQADTEIEFHARGTITDTAGTVNADVKQTGAVSVTTWNAPSTAKISNIYGVNL